ncbi:enoyl-CoA hydratase/isomerase family protein [Xinfangfangia sp. D13-10-4-6]|uniref:enoyl-CoA hydratase/isomerase family protein n=1 Tax=Pseudogemmobacter hezensis TaxID=2737662 RepID=UPI001551BFCD|nr:enoyl-CoA hydratase/isomerase family protein [Pseudogemmobacter hezensis]NPD15710.1 enoyl-CoA hydratase/isomerase family protein [Pseudogemmobacter hezensis]
MTLTGERDARENADGAGLVSRDAGPDGRVLLLEINNPPLNALTPAIRQALFDALQAEIMAAETENRALRPVVISGAGGCFSAATLVEMGADAITPAPTLAAICERLDAWSAPVVAAVNGRAAGPGAELALACHARVVANGTKIIFPEAGLGLPPMAGSSQRLPRLTGPKEALNLLLNARTISAEEALALGLADQVTEGDPRAAAIAGALRMGGPRPVIARDAGLADVPGYAAVIAQARETHLRNPMPAPARIIDCIEAALYLPPGNGLALEAVAFEDLLASPESRGLIAAARAERAAHLLPPEIARLQPEEIRVLGLAGAGPQLAALALLALGRGLRVIWAAPEQEGDMAAHERITGWVRERLTADMRAGRLTPAQLDSDLARFQTHQPIAALQAAGLLVHGRVSDLIDRMQRQVPQIVQLVIGGARGRPGLTIAPSGRVCEISTAGAASPQALAASWRLLRGFGLQPVLSAGLPQIGRQVVGAGQAALQAMLGMGVPRRLLASVLTGFGQEIPDLPDPFGEAPPRGMEAPEVLHRWLGAMANEGYRLISEGVVPGTHAPDAPVTVQSAVRAIDFLMVHGHGFPRWQGGPMHQADRRGPMVLRSDLRRWQGDDAIWQPNPVLDRLVSKGGRRAAA